MPCRVVACAAAVLDLLLEVNYVAQKSDLWSSGGRRLIASSMTLYVAEHFFCLAEVSCPGTGTVNAMEGAGGKKEEYDSR